MPLKFTKMQGLGNDFVVFDAIHQQVQLSPKQLRHLADRRFGIGCDQILLVEPPRSAGTEFHYRIFNADGSEVEQCGNGARCFARFVRDQGLSDQDSIRVGTAAGDILLEIQSDRQVRVNMGRPIFEPEQIPFQALAQADRYALEIEGETLQVGAVSMGNPHAVFQVPDVDQASVARLGPAIEHHPRFPNRVNVGFMQVLDPTHIRLRVWERGAGETLACGTGACAAMVIGRRWGQLGPSVRVSLPGGDLRLEWTDASTPVMMTGPAESVFEGSISP